MKRLLFCVLFVVGIGGVPQLVDCVVSAQAAKAAKMDAEIKQDIINQSIAAYAGSCPCPDGVESLLAGDVDTGKTILRDYINATS